MNCSPDPQGFENLQWKLWIYTNYDCNLQCSYCLAQSSPRAARRGMDLAVVQQLVDEAAAAGFSGVFFTGGEPLLLEEIYPMLAYAAQRLPTTLLTNAMLLNNRRLAALQAVASDQLTLQVSLDGGQAAAHDAYRGAGSWARTVTGIETLLARGFQVRLSTTVTDANAAHLDELCAFHQALGIPESDHLIRPLARRGFSNAGLEVGMQNLSPELTVNHVGVYWHPLATDADLLVTPQIFPLAGALQTVRAQLLAHARGEAGPLKTFT